MGLAAIVLAALAPGTAYAASCSASAAPGVDWTDCDKKLIILSGTDLKGATLVGTNFTSTDLRDTNLMAANLEKATLVRASLAGAKAEGAKFDRIEAYRTNFS
ncbi:MAG TPA: pentapeptide repeat-containing protein, partial [Rhizobiaceae bacterium]